MFRRHFILSALVMPAFPTIVLGSGRKILVAYYSWYDNTFQEQIRPSDIDATTSASLQAPGQVTMAARWIGEATAAQVIPILAKEPYPVNYDDCLDQAIDEKTRKYRPALSSRQLFPEFDFLFLGFPNWSYTLPMTVCSFLEMLPAKGKIIAPFCVHGTGGLARTSAELRRCARNAKILSTLSINRDDLAHSEQTVKEWALYALKQTF